MRSLSIVAVTATLIFASGTAPSPAVAASNANCFPDKIAQSLHEKLNENGKSDADIRDLLSNQLKRKMLIVQIVKGSNCSVAQVDQALSTLDTQIKRK